MCAASGWLTVTADVRRVMAVEGSPLYLTGDQGVHRPDVQVRAHAMPWAAAHRLGFRLIRSGSARLACVRPRWIPATESAADGPQ